MMQRKTNLTIFASLFFFSTIVDFYFLNQAGISKYKKLLTWLFQFLFFLVYQITTAILKTSKLLDFSEYVTHNNINVRIT